MARIVCWGELVWDLFPDGPRLGGGAANVAYHLARLGNQVSLVSRVGADELGRRALEQLGASGIDTSLVQIDRTRATGSVRVELEDGEPRFTLAQRAAWDAIEYHTATARALAAADAICHGTLAQRMPLALGALERALAEAPPSLLRVCDLNVRLPHTTREAIEAALAGLHVVKLNEAEAAVVEQLFGVRDAVEFLLAERGLRLVALTRGAAGATLVTRDRRIEHAGEPVADGDRVGAGDAFTAVLAHHAVLGTPLESLIERANRYAGFVASQPGAMPPIPDALSRVTAA